MGIVCLHNKLINAVTFTLFTFASTWHVCCQQSKSPAHAMIVSMEYHTLPTNMAISRGNTDHFMGLKDNQNSLLALFLHYLKGTEQTNTRDPDAASAMHGSLTLAHPSHVVTGLTFSQQLRTTAQTSEFRLPTISLYKPNVLVPSKSLCDSPFARIQRAFEFKVDKLREERQKQMAP